MKSIRAINYEILRSFKEALNCSLMEIVRYVNGTRGPFLQFEVKCPCGNFYIRQQKELLNISQTKDYTKCKCKVCEIKGVNYEHLYPVEEPEVVEAEIIEQEVVGSAVVYPKKTSIQTTLSTTEWKTKTELLKFFQIYFRKIGWIIDCEKKITISKTKSNYGTNRTSYIFSLVCPGCLNSFKLTHSQSYSRLNNGEFAPIPLLCNVCMTKRGRLEFDESKEFAKNVSNNLENPLIAKSIIPIIDLNIDHPPRTKFDFNQIPNKITGFTKSSNLYNSDPSRCVWFIGLQCPSCNNEFIRSSRSITSLYGSKTTRKLNCSTFLLCEVCNSLFNYNDYDKQFQKHRDKNLTPLPFYNPGDNFDREFFHQLIKNTEVFTSDQFLKKIDKLEKMEDEEISNSLIVDEILIDIDIEEPVIEQTKEEKTMDQNTNPMEQANDLLDKLSDKLRDNSINQMKKGDGFDIYKSIFQQLVTDPYFKKLLTDRVTGKLSAEYVAKIQSTDSMITEG